MIKRSWLLVPIVACATLAASPAQATAFAVFPAALVAGVGSLSGTACGNPVVPAAGPVARPQLSKSASILGGTPSRMELILRQQGAAAAAPAPTFAPAPALSFGIGCAARPSVPGTAALILQPRAPTVSAPDDFLSSRRLPISRTAFDAQWARVSHATLPGRTVRRIGLSTDGMALPDRLAAINAWANKRIRYTEDAQQYSAADYWADPRQTLRRGAGDCEDIAILKMQMLAAVGVPRSAMYLTIARDLVRRADHALLVVRDGDRSWLLDNATDALTDANAAQDYRPIFSFGESGKWLHGY